jgi:hypothetical protein
LRTFKCLREFDRLAGRQAPSLDRSLALSCLDRLVVVASSAPTSISGCGQFNSVHASQALRGREFRRVYTACALHLNDAREILQLIVSQEWQACPRAPGMIHV